MAVGSRTAPKGSPQSEETHQRILESKTGREWFSPTPPALKPYLANLDEYGNTAIQPGPVFAPHNWGMDDEQWLSCRAPDAMLDFLGETAAAKAIESAVIKITREKLKSLAAGKMGYTTSQVGDLVASCL